MQVFSYSKRTIMHSRLSFVMKKGQTVFPRKCVWPLPEPHKFITSCSSWFRVFGFSLGLTQLLISWWLFNSQFGVNSFSIYAPCCRLFFRVRSGRKKAPQLLIEVLS